MDFKEYSRLRSIARKRLERSAAAGLMPLIKLPTVKEARASDNPEAFMAAVKSILAAGSTVTEIRRSGSAPVVQLPQLPKMPKQLSSEEKRARRNEQKRRSKAKRAVEKAAGSEAEGRKRVGYLKALETVAAKWRDAGIDVGNWLGVMSPGMSKKFVEYMEYRFAQGDYKNRYTIDTFIRDFGTLVQRGYDFNDIQSDFSAFLAKQKELQKGKRRTNKYGIDSDEVDSVWRMFVKG
ncbi:MAG: hypothetical protein IKY08_02130 [Firmicutes bacterium]|nr:hypothetical protein [Bacillota bacterium]